MEKLYTIEPSSLPQIPWDVYPRPLLKREQWLCLNGFWDFSFKNSENQLQRGRIMVPFCPESLLSGIGQSPVYGSEMVYSRSFEIPESWGEKRIMLHFGAVSRVSRVLVDGIQVGSHDSSSYLPFSCDISSALDPGKKVHSLELRAINDISHQYPWGKQKEKRGGMWYTPCSGIWQTVWMEPIPETPILGLDVETGIAFGKDSKALHAQIVIKAKAVNSGTVRLKEARIKGEGQSREQETLLGSYPFMYGLCVIELEDPKLWSPEEPCIYEFELESEGDRVQSYFALRDLKIKSIKGKKRLCLNDRPYFFNGLLDQGYWSDGLYTPAGPEFFEKDIAAMKSLGFNVLRKHIKIEPQLFYEACDRLGMIVFQDMVNCGEYNFVRDTGLPTLKIQGMPDSLLNRDKKTRANFLASMEDSVLLLKNHPSICLWTIFNEGWGQFCADDAYEKLSYLDSSRFIDSTSGWFHQKKSDVDSLHIYFGKLHLGREDKAQLLSEFGGYVWKPEGHCFNKEKTYGYKIFKDRESYVEALKSLYLDQVLPLAKEGLCGAIYTQVSDVEDETNGLFSYDRAVLKVDPKEFAGITPLLQEAVKH